jgi:spore coat protein U-like protein
VSLKPSTYSDDEEKQMERTAMKWIVAGAIAAIAGSAAAGGTHVITVSASVTGVCKIVDATSTLGFAALNPATGGTVAATWSGGKFACTKGTAYTITSDDGLWESAAGGASNRMRLTGATGVGCANSFECIRYTLTSATAGTGLGIGGGANDISFNVTGQTLLADYVNANVGSYSDTVTLTVAP